MLSVVSRLAPFAFEVFALVLDLNEGLNERPPQAPTWKGLDRFCVAPAARAGAVKPLNVVSVLSTLQLVGLSRNPCLLMLTAMCFRRRGMPPTILGMVLVAVTRAVYWLTVSVPRVTT